MRVLLAGWFSFSDGEATAGDVLAVESVARCLRDAGIAADVAWSPVFRPGALRLEDAAPGRYSDLVFVCGPVAGRQVARLHQRYAGCRRIAVGVSVVDPADPAAIGFHAIVARDRDGQPPARDLAATGPPPAAVPVPVVGVALTGGQGEYGGRRRHDEVSALLTGWLGTQRCARIPLETRLDRRDWRLCSSPRAFLALLSRMDLVVTMRLHGLALALRCGVPAVAVDPVAGGGKVSAQAAAWGWPAVVAAQDVADRRLLDRHWRWCLSAAGRAAADQARLASEQPTPLLAGLVDALGAQPVPLGPGAGGGQAIGNSG